MPTKVKWFEQKNKLTGKRATRKLLKGNRSFLEVHSKGLVPLLDDIFYKKLQFWVYLTNLINFVKKVQIAYDLQFLRNFYFQRTCQPVCRWNLL
jgi:hypothetical protein